MKVVLSDHGKILHWAGAHQLFPVRGATPNEVAFASHGALEGRSPIGWQELFPALDRTDSVVVADDEAGTLTLVPSDKAAGYVAADGTAGAAAPSAH